MTKPSPAPGDVREVTAKTLTGLTGTLDDDLTVHALRDDDIRWSVCGIWVGDGTWYLSSTFDPPVESDCPQCLALLDPEPPPSP